MFSWSPMVIYFFKYVMAYLTHECSERDIIHSHQERGTENHDPGTQSIVSKCLCFIILVTERLTERTDRQTSGLCTVKFGYKDGRHQFTVDRLFTDYTLRSWILLVYGIVKEL